MKEQLTALYELQSLDVKITKINTRLAALDGGKVLKRTLAGAKSAGDAAESALSAQEAELMDAELKLKTIDEKRATFEKRMYGGMITNPKELSAIEREVKMLKSQQEQLDGRTLELYDGVDKARSAAQAARQKVAEFETQLKAALASEAAEKASLESELKELTSLRESASATVTDPALMSRYEAVRKRNGNTGIAKLMHDRCEGCRTSVTSFTTRKLFEDKEIVSCENCGRILLLDPDA